MSLGLDLSCISAAGGASQPGLPHVLNGQEGWSRCESPTSWDHSGAAQRVNRVVAQAVSAPSLNLNISCISTQSVDDSLQRTQIRSFVQENATYTILGALEGDEEHYTVRDDLSILGRGMAKTVNKAVVIKEGNHIPAASYSVSESCGLFHASLDDAQQRTFNDISGILGVVRATANPRERVVFSKRSIPFGKLAKLLPTEASALDRSKFFLECVRDAAILTNDLHVLGFCHGDIKPLNLGFLPGENNCMLLDVDNLSKFDSSPRPRTLSYSSPTRHDLDLDEPPKLVSKSDVYSLALTLKSLLEGKDDWPYKTEAFDGIEVPEFHTLLESLEAVVGGKDNLDNLQSVIANATNKSRDMRSEMNTFIVGLNDVINRINVSTDEIREHLKVETDTLFQMELSTLAQTNSINPMPHVNISVDGGFELDNVFGDYSVHINVSEEHVVDMDGQWSNDISIISNQEDEDGVNNISCNVYEVSLMENQIEDGDPMEVSVDFED